jgi:hypothetical protein
MLIRLLYVSEIVGTVSDVDIQVIIGAAQMKNRRQDVTGMLAWSEQHFVQLLEGRREALDSVMRSVVTDARHRQVRTLLDEQIVRRQFARFAMGQVHRQDVANEMHRMHVGGCSTDDEARALIERILVLGDPYMSPMEADGGKTTGYPI